jgi:hypothetical protein
MKVMLIIIIILIIIFILYFVVRRGSSFSATTLQSYPSPLPGPVLKESLSWTSIDDIPTDDSILTYQSTNTDTPAITCYNMNADTTLNTTFTSWSLPNSYDETIVNYYLSYDTYASSFMTNSEKVMVPNTIVDVSKYNVGAPPTLLATKKSRAINDITIDYYYLSWDDVKSLSSVSAVTGSTAVVNTDTIKKIKGSVLYGLIKLYYNPGMSDYSGLVYDFSTNYQVGVTTSVRNSPNASTMNIKFTHESKHAVWLYLLARAQWINNTIRKL